MSRQRPEALVHAEWLEKSLTIGAKEAAAELRRLLNEVERLKAALPAESASLVPLSISDGKWYLVRYEGLGKTYEAPALYREAAKAFYSVEFSGIPTSAIEVICEIPVTHQRIK